MYYLFTFLLLSNNGLSKEENREQYNLQLYLTCKVLYNLDFIRFLFR